MGRNRNGSFTLESILDGALTDDNAEPEDDSSSTLLYEKIVNFLIGECVKQRNENLGLKKKGIDLKAERVRLRGGSHATTPKIILAGQKNVSFQLSLY